jgi:hypothetical protein
MARTHPFSNMQPPPPERTTVSRVYVSDGDTNGVAYYIGTNLGMAGWTNPHTALRVTVIRSSTLNGVDADLVDRSINYNTTDNNSGEWMAIDLGSNDASRLMVVSDYSLQNGSSGGFDHTPRNWKLQGSNNVGSNDATGVNAATWVDLDTRSNDTSIASSSGAWGHFILGSVPAGYRWLRILATGINNGGDATQFLQIGEFEFYGDFSYVP